MRGSLLLGISKSGVLEWVFAFLNYNIKAEHLFNDFMDAGWECASRRRGEGGQVENGLLLQ